MRTRPLAVALLAAVSGEAHKTGSRVLDDAAAALSIAGSVHLVGPAQTQGKQLVMDLRLQGSEAVGTLDGRSVVVVTMTLSEFGQRATLPAVPTDALDFSQLGSA